MGTTEDSKRKWARAICQARPGVQALRNSARRPGRPPPLSRLRFSLARRVAFSLAPRPFWSLAAAAVCRSLAARGRVFPRPPSLVWCGRGLRFAAPSPAAVFPRARFVGGRPGRGGVFSAPRARGPCPPGLACRPRPPGSGRPAGSPCPRSPLILLETSQTFYKFKALAAAAAPRPSLFWFGRGRRRSVCGRRPPRFFVPARGGGGFTLFGFGREKKARKKAFCGKSVEKFQKIPKMSIIRPILCRKRKNV